MLCCGSKASKVRAGHPPKGHGGVIPTPLPTQQPQVPSRTSDTMPTDKARPDSFQSFDADNLSGTQRDALFLTCNSALDDTFRNSRNSFTSPLIDDLVPIGSLTLPPKSTPGSLSLVRQISDTGVPHYPCPIKLTGPICINKDRKYRTFAPHDFMAFHKLADSVGKPWTERYAAKDKMCFAWDQPPPPNTSTFNLVKVFAIFPDIHRSVMYDVLHDPRFRNEWDESMLKGYNICPLNLNNDIGYYCAKIPGPFSNRDACNQRAWFMTRDGESIIMNTSVAHSDCPKIKGVERAFSYISGYMIRPLRNNENGCTLTYLTCSDPGGWLPSSLMNTFSGKVSPNMMSKLHKVARTYAEWKAKNKPDEKPWLIPMTDFPETVQNYTIDWWESEAGDTRKCLKSTSSFIKT